MSALITGESNLGRSTRHMFRVYSIRKDGRKLYQLTIATHSDESAFDVTLGLSRENPSLSFVVERVAS